MTRNLLFKCPHSGLNVQCRLDLMDQNERGDHYRAVECPACGSPHFINEKTGRVLGESLVGPRGAAAAADRFVIASFALQQSLEGKADEPLFLGTNPAHCHLTK